MCQMDSKTAFLYRELEGEVYMEISDGPQVSKEMKLTKVCKLERS